MRNTDHKIIHTVEHIHFTGWPKDDVPDNEGIEDMMWLMKDAATFLTDAQNDLDGKYHMGKCTPERILVHGSGGIDRTGALIACINAMLTI